MTDEPKSLGNPVDEGGMEKKSALNFDEWDLDPEQLEDSHRIGVRVNLPSLPMEQLIALPKLKDRIRFSNEFRQQRFDELVKQLEPPAYKLIGKKRDYLGFSYQTTWGQLRTRVNDSIVERIYVYWIEGMTKKPEQEPESYYCLKLLFKIQFEGIKHGEQLYEEQFVLVKAPSETEAQKKLLSGHIPATETPYMNSDMRLVRWKFVDFLDGYQAYVFKDLQEQIQEGIEVFSEQKWKKRQPEDNWNGNLDS